MRLKKHSSRTCGFPPSFITVLLLLLPLAGCESNGGSTPKVLHGCELIAVSEIEILVDAKVERPPRETHKEDQEKSFWMSMCNYYAADPGISLGIMIQPLAQPGSPEGAYDSYVASLKSSMPEYQVSPVGDIGRKAMWNDEMAQLTIFDDMYMILVTSMRKDGSNAEKLALAQKVATRVLENTQ